MSPAPALPSRSRSSRPNLLFVGSIGSSSSNVERHRLAEAARVRDDARRRPCGRRSARRPSAARARDTCACASACTVTTPKASLSTGAKIPGVSAFAATSIVPASGNVTVGARDAGVVVLRVVVRDGLARPTACAGAPARRRARRRPPRSAACAAAWYQEPTSMTSAAIPTSAMRMTATKTNTCPDSPRLRVRRAPSFHPLRRARGQVARGADSREGRSSTGT